MKKLTLRQEEILNFIKSYLMDHKYPPAIRDVAENFNISVKGSYDHIKALEKKGYIKCNIKRSRAIEVLNFHDGENLQVKKIPILGTVAAGIPLFAEENFDGNVDLPDNLVGKGRYFALKVRGDSMINVGILDGDLAVINHQEFAENGEIVVAMIDDAVTLKRLYKEKNRVMLKAENPAFPPIYTQDVRVLGKLSCIIRKY